MPILPVRMFSNIVACRVGESICSRLAKDWSGCSNLPSDTSRVNKHSLPIEIDFSLLKCYRKQLIILYTILEV